MGLPVAGRIAHRFLSTLSLRRATYIVGGAGNNAIHFYPRSPCGERQKFGFCDLEPIRFLSTLSLRRATVVDNIVLMPGKFLSTLSLRRATDATLHCLRVMRISIHALLAESDLLDTMEIVIVKIFLSTLSLRRATMPPSIVCASCVFLSTLSLRRATYLDAWQPCNVRHFYPRSPCGERL